MPSRLTRARHPGPVVLVHVATVPQTLLFLDGQPGFMRELGFSVHAVACPSDLLSRFGLRQRVPVHGVAMTRRITPLRDLAAVVRLWALLRRLGADVVDAHTPKAGVVAMIAATLARVPVRVYHVHGLPLTTARGLRGRLLRLTERVSCGLADRVLPVSRSMQEILVREGLCRADKAKVLLSGTLNGVDSDRLRPDPALRDEARAQYRIPRGARVVGFVGRLARDKGVRELAEAWSALRESEGDVHLLLVGAEDSTDPLPPALLTALRADPRVRFAGVVGDNARREYAAMDVLALPSYREGFGMVAIEAGAMGLPVVATRVPGCVDSVADGVTGTLVPPRDASALAEALRRYLHDPALRAGHGEAGRRRVDEEFRRGPLCEALGAEYVALLEAAGRPAPRRAPDAGGPRREDVVA